MNWHCDKNIPIETPVLVRIHNEALYGETSLYDVVKKNKSDKYYTHKYYVAALDSNRRTWPINWITGWITFEELEQDWKD